MKGTLIIPNIQSLVWSCQEYCGGCQACQDWRKTKCVHFDKQSGKVYFGEQQFSTSDGSILNSLGSKMRRWELGWTGPGWIQLYRQVHNFDEFSDPIKKRIFWTSERKPTVRRIRLSGCRSLSLQKRFALNAFSQHSRTKYIGAESWV